MTQTSFRFAVASGRVYGPTTVEDRRILQPRVTSIKARVLAWFERNRRAATAEEVASALGLRVENCVASRLSDLVADGVIERTEQLVPGRYRTSVHKYRLAEREQGRSHE